MTHPAFRPLVIALALTALGACNRKTTVVSEAPGAMSLAPVCTDGVIIYDSDEGVPGNYREVAYIETSGNSVWNRDADLKREMQEKAGKLGANGIIVNAFTTTRSTAKIIGAAIGTGDAQTKGSALAIYIPSESGRTSSICSGR